MKFFAKVLIKFDCKSSNKLDFNSNEGSNTLIAFLVPLLLSDSFLNQRFLYLFSESIQNRVKFGNKSFKNFLKPSNYESFIIKPTSSEKEKKKIHSFGIKKSNGSNSIPTKI